MPTVYLDSLQAAWGRVEEASEDDYEQAAKQVQSLSARVMQARREQRLPVPPPPPSLPLLFTCNSGAVRPGRDPGTQHRFLLLECFFLQSLSCDPPPPPFPRHPCRPSAMSRCPHGVVLHINHLPPCVATLRRSVPGCPCTGHRSIRANPWRHVPFGPRVASAGFAGARVSTSDHFSKPLPHAISEWPHCCPQMGRCGM